MSKFLIFFYSAMLFTQTEVWIVGSVHFPTKTLNADTILELFKKINPDLILLESDHSNFNEDFTFKRSYDENEWNASVAYKKINPKVKFRPFEIEGRNSIRVDLGIEGHNPIFNQIYDLYDQNKLTKSQHEIWARFVVLADSLDLVGKKSLGIINSAETNNLVQERQFYQYYKVLEIVNTHPYFETMEIKKTNRSHTGRSFFQTYRDFELKRNHQMLQNILKQIKNVDADRVVVITGFYHKFYLENELRYYQESYKFKLKMFD